jgi:hypothetical protein
MVEYLNRLAERHTELVKNSPEISLKGATPRFIDEGQLVISL